MSDHPFPDALASLGAIDADGPDGPPEWARMKGTAEQLASNRPVVMSAEFVKPVVKARFVPVTRPNIIHRPLPRTATGRRQSRTSTRRATAKSRGPDEPSDEPPPSAGFPPPDSDVEAPRGSDLNVVWAEARHRLETREEFRVLGELCRIRADWMAA